MFLFLCYWLSKYEAPLHQAHVALQLSHLTSTADRGALSLFTLISYGGTAFSPAVLPLVRYLLPSFFSCIEETTEPFLGLGFQVLQLELGS